MYPIDIDLPPSDKRRLGLSFLEPTGHWYACLGFRFVRYPSQGCREARIVSQTLEQPRVLNIPNCEDQPERSSPISGRVDCRSFLLYLRVHTHLPYFSLRSMPAEVSQPTSSVRLCQQCTEGIARSTLGLSRLRSLLAVVTI
jgi:hypothetical protein